MKNRANNGRGNWVEEAKNAASGYGAVILGVACFLLVLVVVMAVVRFIVGVGAAGTGVVGTAANTAITPSAIAPSASVAIASASPNAPVGALANNGEGVLAGPVIDFFAGTDV